MRAVCVLCVGLRARSPYARATPARGPGGCGYVRARICARARARGVFHVFPGGLRASICIVVLNSLGYAYIRVYAPVRTQLLLVVCLAGAGARGFVCDFWDFQGFWVFWVDFCWIFGVFVGFLGLVLRFSSKEGRNWFVWVKS